MIVVAPATLKAITDAAEAAYPDECCGLLVGRPGPGGTTVVGRAEPSRNLAEGDRRRSFEVDPQARFDLMRRLEGTPEHIVGLYHSHPGAPAEPSPRDLERAWEPDLVWLITAVHQGQAIHTTAHVVDADGDGFRRVGLRTSDAPAATPAPGEPA